MDIKIVRLIEDLRLKTDAAKSRKVFEEKRLKAVESEFERIRLICDQAALEGKTEVYLSNWSSRKQVPHLLKGTPMSSSLMERIQREGFVITERRREQEDPECEEYVRVEFDYIISWERSSPQIAFPSS